MSGLLRAAALLLPAICAAGQGSSLLVILAGELERNFRVLKEKGDPAPYFLSYAVTEVETAVVSAAMGALQSSNRGHNRYLDVSVRVGSPQLDNYRRLSGDQPRFTSGLPLPIENHDLAIRQRVWLDTDRAYRLAAERLTKLKTGAQVKLSGDDDSPDFSREEPSLFSEEPIRLAVDVRQWEERARRLSAEVAGNPDVLASNVVMTATRETRYFASTEGTRLQHGWGVASIAVYAYGKAADGADLSVSASFEAEDPGRLPGEEAVVEAINRVAKNLAALKRAPEAEPFVGPAILSGRAAGVFFHEIFGHRIEGHRQKDETEGQTFAKSVGAQVLPAFLNVYSDPTRRAVEGVHLLGHYRYDEEGIPARPVLVVENGVLKTFLLSRSPTRGFLHSNGHGRRAPGFEAVSRQANLLVDSSRTVPAARLRQMLIEEVKRRGKAYGLYFEEVVGGYTQTGRRGLQGFTVIPILVYRVYADGRPDELVRGADIVGTPLASFAKILATSDRAEVFNGYCGAESGVVPVSAVAPAMLVGEIEIQRKEKSLDRPPLLPAPEPTGGLVIR